MWPTQLNIQGRQVLGREKKTLLSNVLRHTDSHPLLSSFRLKKAVGATFHGGFWKEASGSFSSPADPVSLSRHTLLLAGVGAPIHRAADPFTSRRWSVIWLDSYPRFTPQPGTDRKQVRYS